MNKILSFTIILLLTFACKNLDKQVETNTLHGKTIRHSNNDTVFVNLIDDKQGSVFTFPSNFRKEYHKKLILYIPNADTTTIISIRDTTNKEYIIDTIEFEERLIDITNLPEQDYQLLYDAYNYEGNIELKIKR